MKFNCIVSILKIKNTLEIRVELTTRDKFHFIHGVSDKFEETKFKGKSICIKIQNLSKDTNVE